MTLVSRPQKNKAKGMTWGFQMSCVTSRSELFRLGREKNQTPVSKDAASEVESVQLMKLLWRTVWKMTPPHNLSLFQNKFMLCLSRKVLFFSSRCSYNITSPMKPFIAIPRMAPPKMAASCMPSTRPHHPASFCHSLLHFSQSEVWMHWLFHV